MEWTRIYNVDSSSNQMYSHCRVFRTLSSLLPGLFVFCLESFAIYPDMKPYLPLFCRKLNSLKADPWHDSLAQVALTCNMIDQQAASLFAYFGKLTEQIQPNNIHSALAWVSDFFNVPIHAEIAGKLFVFSNASTDLPVFPIRVKVTDTEIIIYYPRLATVETLKKTCSAVGCAQCREFYSITENSPCKQGCRVCNKCYTAGLQLLHHCPVCRQGPQTVSGPIKLAPLTCCSRCSRRVALINCPSGCMICESCWMPSLRDPGKTCPQCRTLLPQKFVTSLIACLKLCVRCLMSRATYLESEGVVCADCRSVSCGKCQKKKPGLVGFHSKCSFCKQCLKILVQICPENQCPGCNEPISFKMYIETLRRIEGRMSLQLESCERNQKLAQLRTPQPGSILCQQCGTLAPRNPFSKLFCIQCSSRNAQKGAFNIRIRRRYN